MASERPIEAVNCLAHSADRIALGITDTMRVILDVVRTRPMKV